MTITELIEKLQWYQAEVGCDGERCGPHNLKSSVSFVTEDEEFEIDEIDLDLMGGCFCPYGITINLKKL